MDNAKDNLNTENNTEYKEPKLPFQPFSNGTVEKYKEIYNIVEYSEADVVEQYDDNNDNEQLSENAFINSTYEDFEKFVDNHKQKFSYRRSFIYDKTKPVNPEEAIRTLPEFFKKYASEDTNHILKGFLVSYLSTSLILYFLAFSFLTIGAFLTPIIFITDSILNVVGTLVTFKTKKWIFPFIMSIESTAVLIWYLYTSFQLSTTNIGGILFFLLIFITFIIAKIIFGGALYYRLKLLEKAHKIYLDILEEPEFHI